MPTCFRLILLGLLIALLAGLWSAPETWAQQPDRPRSLPTQDVTVNYHLDEVVPGYPRKMQIAYAGAGERVRIDYFRWAEAKYPYLVLIFDRSADRVISVYPESKSYVDRQIGDMQNPGALLSDNMILTRLGTDVVAHAPCTVWKIAVSGKPDDGGTACVSNDSIVLRLAVTIPTAKTMIATTTHYGAPPDGAFSPPAGFKRKPEP